MNKMALGYQELLIILAIVVVLFGASRLPQLAKSLGQSRKAFKEGMREAEEEERAEAEQRSLNSTAAAAAPQINKISDEDLMAEMRNRAQLKQQ